MLDLNLAAPSIGKKPPRRTVSDAETLAIALKGIRQASGGWQCFCPAHENERTSTRSFSVADKDGKTAFCCHAKCSQEAIMAALVERGLWSAPRNYTKPQEIWGAWSEVEIYDYNDRDGNPSFRVRRFERYSASGNKEKRFPQEHLDRDGNWITTRGDTRGVLYRWRELLNHPEVVVFVCEGEKDTNRLWKLGCVATTINGSWKGVDIEDLRGRDVIVLEDADRSGVKRAQDAAIALRGVAKSVRVVRLPGQEYTAEKHGKDVSDWLDEDPKRDASALFEVCNAVALWQPSQQQEVQELDAVDLESVRASDIDMEALDWLWPDRFALGKVGLIVGLPDEGKGQVLAYTAATITTGGEWPCGEGTSPRGNVIVLSAEDDFGDTVVPRLVAAGADLTRVHFIKMARHDGEKRMFSLITDIDALRRKIVQIGDVVQVQIDPMSAYLGVGKIDSFRGTDVRAVLTPLMELAKELHVSIVGVMHFNKKVDVTNALLRISDSLAFGAAARHVFAVVDDEANQRKLFVRGKNNLARKNIKSLSYGFGVKNVGFDKRLNKDIEAPYVIWMGHVDISATEAMQATADNRATTPRDDAKQFLADFLADGPMPQQEVVAAAKAELISRMTLRRAKDELGVVAEKGPNRTDKWIWALPSRAE